MKKTIPKEDIIQCERGFTIMEVLVASFLGSLIFGLVVANILINHGVYFEDIKRTSINSNLRSAMDIISMNIRQAGENLSDTFPTIIIEDGSDDTILTLRRSPIQEVITLCNLVDIGDTNVTTWTDTSSTPACLQPNAQPLVQSFMSTYNNLNGEALGYVYNSITKQGEFTTVELAPNEKNLRITGASHRYDPLVSHLYLLEEMSFTLDIPTRTLNLYRNGDTVNPNTIAFEVTQFNARIEFPDGSTDSDYDPTSTDPGWKSIDKIEITLLGEKSIKSKVIKSSISAKYFPRNILSS